MNKAIPPKILTSLALLACLTGAAAHAAEEKTINDGVFTTEQVDAGESVYNNSCKSCHDKRFYRDALRAWKDQPLLYLWETVLGTMPADNPGSLLLDEYTNVIAFILSEQGFPAGETILDPDAGMDTIHITAP
ncbi:MAG: c-type cytochrome [Pseudohongiellaceae bacterium]